MALEERIRKFEEFSYDDSSSNEKDAFQQDLKDYLTYLKSEEDAEKSRLGKNYCPQPFYS